MQDSHIRLNSKLAPIYEHVMLNHDLLGSEVSNIIGLLQEEYNLLGKYPIIYIDNDKNICDPDSKAPLNIDNSINLIDDLQIMLNRN